MAKVCSKYNPRSAKLSRWIDSWSRTYQISLVIAPQLSPPSPCSLVSSTGSNSSSESESRMSTWTAPLLAFGSTTSTISESWNGSGKLSIAAAAAVREFKTTCFLAGAAEDELACPMQARSWDFVGLGRNYNRRPLLVTNINIHMKKVIITSGY